MQRHNSMFALSLFLKHSCILHIFWEFFELTDYDFLMLKQLIIFYIFMYSCCKVLANILQGIVHSNNVVCLLRMMFLNLENCKRLIYGNHFHQVTLHITERRNQRRLNERRANLYSNRPHCKSVLWLKVNYFRSLFHTAECLETSKPCLKDFLLIWKHMEFKAYRYD